MATLTPISEALNRSTPGFDALMGAVQQQTNRIIANKQFAKELQTRKEFAVFQTNLQLDSQIELARRMLPIETEKAQIAADIQEESAKDLAGHREQLGRRTMLMQHLLNQNALDEATNRKIREVQAEGPEGLSPSEQTAQANLWIRTRQEEREDLETRFPRATKEYGAIVQTQLDGSLAQDVSIELGAERIEQLNYGSYVELLQAEEQRLALLERLKKEFEERKTIIPGSTEDETTMGLAELQQAIREVEGGRGNILKTTGGPTAHANLIAKYQDQQVAYLSPIEQENRRFFTLDWDHLTGTGFMDKLIPPYTKAELESMGEDEGKKYLMANMKTVEQAETVAIRLDAEQNTDGSYIDSYDTLRSLYNGTQPGLQKSIGNLVFNYNFDPMDASDFEAAFLTKEEMADRIWDNLFSNNAGEQANAARQGAINLTSPYVNNRIRTLTGSNRGFIDGRGLPLRAEE